MIPLTLALGIFLATEKDALEGKTAVVSGPRPPSAAVTGGIAPSGLAAFGFLEEEIHARFEDVMTWDRNPWKRPRKDGFGGHYLTLSGSSDPMDRARAQELQRLAKVWLARVTDKYPELRAEPRVVPDEQNGFLQWLDFAERHGVAPPWTSTPSILKRPPALENDGWDREVARTWLAEHQATLDELRAIGLLPDRSNSGISLDRWHFLPARTMKECCDALMADARLRAEDGDAAGALESVRAVRGLASHFSGVESPTLLAATVDILVQLGLQKQVMEHILPALPAGSVDADAWEAAVRPEVQGPAGFARLMRGEWEVTAGYWLVPMLCDPEERRPPRDPDALVDAHAGYFRDVLVRCASPRPEDLLNIESPPFPDTSHLSRRSREIIDLLFIGERAWRKGWERAQSISALTRAGFSVMRGGPVPDDPVHGLPYRWDPATRTLRVPDHPDFAEMNVPDLKVPRK